MASHTYGQLQQKDNPAYIDAEEARSLCCRRSVGRSEATHRLTIIGIWYDASVKNTRLLDDCTRNASCANYTDYLRVSGT